ncbi:Ig-like domain-containing protein, partial [Colwellia sp. E2M01]|uniref:Ig-like domain-containing protein n=1 Tax=Colwellia sp. E2M01 TaxID=2841561 RepID=UPI001C094FAD
MMMKKNTIHNLIVATTLGLSSTTIYAGPVKVDINLDTKHEVGGVSDFNRKKHITIHSNLTEKDWDEEAEVLDYLMNDLDVYFGRDNGSATWIFKATDQASDEEGNPLAKPDLDSLTPFGTWFKGTYDALPAERLAHDARADEMIMGITPHGPFPTQSYNAEHMAGTEATGKYILRHIDDGAEWVGEFIDKFFRKNGETSGMQMPKYWEVINEPDMDINRGGAFVMSSFEQIFEYHNLVAAEIKSKLPENERPLVGGMTWGLHDFESADLSTRYTDQDKAIFNKYNVDTTDGDLLDLLISVTDSASWATRKDKYFQWDGIWKGFMDASGENMDFYSIHLYDWSKMGTLNDNDRYSSTFRRGMKTEAILDMVEWYDAQVNGKENLKPWVISEYGAIASQHEKLSFITNDYRYADWLHLRTFNQMFMQLLTRPSQIVKSMPFSPIKGEWGLLQGPDGEAIRYEASLMQTDEALAANYADADWYVTDKIQWYELWSDVKGTRVDTHSSDPDIQVDAYVDGNHTYLILNNLEWYDIPVDLSFMGGGDSIVTNVNMKHSYLAEGLSSTNLGRPILAEAMLNALPESVTLEPGSTIILDITYDKNIPVTSTMVEKKYYGESLAGAGKGDAAKGQVHRIPAVNGQTFTGHVNGVTVPAIGKGEAKLRIAAEFNPSNGAKKGNNTKFTINGHDIDVPTQVGTNKAGNTVTHHDLMGPEVDETKMALNLFELTIPLEFLQEDNEIVAKIASAKTITAMTISTWEVEEELLRTAVTNCDLDCIMPTDLTISGDTSVSIKETIALSADIMPIDADNKKITWTTSDVTVASVDQNGLVTGTSGGSATITATTEEGVLVATHTVTVTTIPPSSIDLSVETTALALNETLQVNASVLPKNASNKAITWASSDEAIATVDQSGVVSAISIGDVTITATAVDGGVEGSTMVSVVAIPVESVELASTAVVVLPGTYQAVAQFTPSTASDLSKTWSSDDTSIATVNDNGLITGVSVGSATITVTTTDGGFESDIVVNVLDATSVSDDALIIEAEDFTATGGSFAGFVKSDSTIGDNQTGDWAEFQVNFTEAGVYRFTLSAGSPHASEVGVKVSIDGVVVTTADITSTGSFDTMAETIVTDNLLVSTSGTHTIRIESTGKEARWQWNADKLSFVLLSTIQGIDTGTDP